MSQSDPRCPKCGKPFPLGDPRAVVPGQPCVECDAAQPGDLWEWAEDRCQVCGALVGAGLRFMHVGLCETCAAAPKH